MRGKRRLTGNMRERESETDIHREVKSFALLTTALPRINKKRDSVRVDRDRQTDRQTEREAEREGERGNKLDRRWVQERASGCLLASIVPRTCLR